MSAGGVAFALVLILVLQGVFAGSEEQVTAYVQESHADVWVMQAGVSNMHMATSVLSADLGPRLKEIEGVRRVSSILYFAGNVRINGSNVFSYMVGFDPAQHAGGPWKMAEGTARVRNGEVVIDKTLAARNGIVIGDRVKIRGAPLKVVGLSLDTYSLANTVVFMTRHDLEKISMMPGIVSYYLIEVDKGFAPSMVAREIRDSVPGLNALTGQKFIANDREVIRQMGIDIIASMAMVAYLVGIMVVGLAIYTATVSRVRDYGVLKAIGAKGVRLYWAVVLQAVLSSLIGFAVGLILTFGVAQLVRALVPELLVVIEPAAALRVFEAALIMGVAAALVPTRRMARIEPSIAFQA